jgi:3-oxoacyl-[acyl-carrier protein] reductase
MTDTEHYDILAEKIGEGEKFEEKDVLEWYGKYFKNFSKFIDACFYTESDLEELKSHTMFLAKKVPDYLKVKARDIFVRKNKVRSGLWKDVGAVGACIEIHAKLSRLQNSKEEFDRDSVIDLFNYLIILLMCLEGKIIKVKSAEEKYAVITGTHPGGLGEIIEQVFRINGYTTIKYGSDVSIEGAKKFFDRYPFSKIDVLINNYGIDKLNWIGELEESDYRIFDVNLKGVSVVVNELVKRGYKNTRILNVCSQTYRVAQRCTSLYCASKAGLAHLTRVMARELAPKGYIVNAIAPGKILGTLMTEKIDRRVLELRGWTEEEADSYALGLIPMGRFTNKEEVAKAIIQIVNLPDYINGSIIDMTGGQ